MTKIAVELEREDAQALQLFLNDENGLRAKAAAELLKQSRGPGIARATTTVRALGALAAAIARALTA